MKLLVDTDAFCKLGKAGLLEDGIRVLGADLHECGRLPALPYMLRKGRLRESYGTETCDALIPVAEGMPVLPQVSASWIDKLASIDAIDPGDAQILSAAAEFNLMVLSGDKRALRAVKDVEGFPDGLAGRVCSFEAVLLALCQDLGTQQVRDRVAPLSALDKTIAVCFSSGSSNPSEGLRSYYESLAKEVRPAEPQFLDDDRISVLAVLAEQHRSEGESNRRIIEAGRVANRVSRSLERAPDFRGRRAMHQS